MEGMVLEFEFEDRKCDGGSVILSFLFGIDFSRTEQELPQVHAVPACLYAISFCSDWCLGVGVGS